MSPDLKLFQSIRVGTADLQHRVVLAPLTRCRADLQRVPGAHVLEYYKQRTSVPGTLAITEATCIDARVGAYFHTPGIWSDEQVAAWKPVRPCLVPSLRIALSPLLALLPSLSSLPLPFNLIGTPLPIETNMFCVPLLL